MGCFKITLIIFIVFLLILIFIAVSNIWISRASKDKIYTDLSSVPYKRTALVLGTNKHTSSGLLNYYFLYRIEAASALYHAGKCSFIIVSGDNSRNNYNEPQQMKEMLIEKGVPKEIIYEDFAGFRTLDSVIRSKKVFGQDELVIVSQDFHNQRALFIAEKAGISAVAYNAKNVSRKASVKTRFRELFAKTMAVVDLYILNRQPKYLGKQIKIK